MLGLWSVPQKADKVGRKNSVWSVPQKADKVGRKNSVKIRKGEKDEKTEKFYRRTKM